VLRNIAYIHAVHQFITAKRLKRRLRLRWGEVQQQHTQYS